MILNKNFPGQIDIQSASSGTKALEIVRTGKIEILFMDIHMPGLNGIETISLIKQINPNIVIVILSAYDQFQYAQKALNLGAFKYLTKPVNRNLIIQTVREAMNSVDSERGKLSDNIELHQKLSLVSTMVESDFIYSCIFNNKGTDFSEYLNYFGLAGKRFFFACIEVTGVNPEQRYDIYEKIRDTLSSKCRCVTGSFMGERIGVFFPVADGGSNQRDLIGSIYTNLATRISGKVRIGVSKIVSDISNAQSSYNEAAAMLSKIDSDGGLSISGMESDEKNSKDSKLYEKIGEKLISAVRAGNSATATQMSKQFIDLLYSTFCDKCDKIKGTMFEYLLKERDAVVKMDSSYKNESMDEAFSFFAKTNSREEMSRFFTERSVECASAAGLARSAEENPIVQKAKEYIDNNLKEVLSLEQLSEKLNVSPFYLSKLFKEETGDTYINYVNSARLEKAKKLLGNGELIIKEIAAEVGYNDQNYFSKMFRQRFGVTPTEFRK